MNWKPRTLAEGRLGGKASVRYLLNVGESLKTHTHQLTVGANLLAMDENDYAGCLDGSVLLTPIASKLAPTEAHHH